MFEFALFVCHEKRIAGDLLTAETFILTFIGVFRCLNTYNTLLSLVP